jgi:hypothetical protein
MFCHCSLNVQPVVCIDSAVGTDGQVAPRTGFMHDFKPKEVLVKVWDQALEGKHVDLVFQTMQMLLLFSFLSQQITVNACSGVISVYVINKKFTTLISVVFHLFPNT